MDSMSAFSRGQAARAAGAKLMVFDWDKAARLIRDRNAKSASAGLASDWEWTGGEILEDGKPLSERSGTYLASLWATPEMEIDGETIDCWRYQDDSPGWDSDTLWPESALAILNNHAEAKS